MPDIRISVTMPDMSKFSAKEYVDRIAQAQRDKTVPELTRLFKLTVDGWDNKPRFDWEQQITSHSIGVRVYSAGENSDQYALVVKGSPPHTIRSKNGGLLHYQPGYRPSTKPRILSSHAKSRFGAYISTPVVNHPGFDAREFDQAIAETHKPDFERDMQDAMRNK
jgi:hypothetical protein